MEDKVINNFKKDITQLIIGASVILAFGSGLIVGHFITKNEAQKKAYQQWCCDTGSYCCMGDGYYE